MKITMVGPFGLQPLGTMRARALPIARDLVSRGHSVSMLLPPWHCPQESGRRVEDSGVLVTNINLGPRLPGLFHLQTTVRLARQVMAARPDVIHAFKPKAYSGLAHWLVARLPLAYRPPVVVDTDDWEGAGGWNELRPYSAAQRLFFTWQERWGLRHAEAVTVASRALETLAWASGAAPERVFYVPNGVGHRQPVAPDEGFQEDRPGHTLLWYTRFVECPLPWILEILARVREAVPDATLLVVGEGRGNEQERLMGLAAERGLAQAVDVVGWEEAALARHFGRASLAVYPFEDTLVNRAKCPAKLLEMLAAGIPVVAEAVGEVREFIRHGETGWLVAPGDGEGFAAGVVQLLRQPELRTHLGRKARCDAWSRLSWERAIGNVERAYHAAGGAQ